MDVSNANPNVCFKAKFLSPRSPEKELVDVVENRLRARFGPIKKVWPVFSATWGGKVRVDERTLLVILGRSRWDRDEWVLMVGAIYDSVGRFRRSKRIRPVQQLKNICLEIHSILTQIPDISDVRWYFQVSRRRSNVVARPDQLPWVQSQ
jgi:hypothetical protein